MRIAVVGYGRMGKEVENHALYQGHEIGAIVSSRNDIKDSVKGLLLTKKEDLLSVDFDVVIDFSHPDTALENLKFYAQNDMKVVMGTTGWLDQLENIKSLFENSKGAIVWSGNFSIGVILFNKMIERVSQIINEYKYYDVAIHEFHHKNKKDSPSGTLLKMGEIILENIEQKSSLQIEALNNEKIDENKLHATSTRLGNIPGTHKVIFDSEFDSIELIHTARSRGGYATGSVQLAEWLKDRQGYFKV